MLLENKKNILPLKKDIGSVALIGPQVDQVTVSLVGILSGVNAEVLPKFGDYVFFNASLNGVSPLQGFKDYLANTSSSTKINYAEGCKLWSNDESGFEEAVNAAQSSDVAIVMVRRVSTKRFSR